MKIEPACLSCALERTLATANRITDDSWLHHKLLRAAMSELVESGRDTTPSEMIKELFVLTQKTLGSNNPFAAEKEEWNHELQGQFERLQTQVAAAEDPLLESLRICAQANIFDNECLSKSFLRKELQATGLLSPVSSVETRELSFEFSEQERFQKDLESATQLLFVHDTAQELTFDSLLIHQLCEQYPNLQIHSVLRKQPILSYATHEDFEQSDLSKFSRVHAAEESLESIGFPMDECCQELKDLFKQADVVLAKGQAALETMNDLDKPVYFLLRLKCQVVANAQGVPTDSLVFLRE